MSEEKQRALEELLPKGSEELVQGQFMSIDENSEAIHAGCNGQCRSGTCIAD